LLGWLGESLRGDLLALHPVSAPIPETMTCYPDPRAPPDRLLSLLTAYPAEEMVGWEVDRNIVCDPKRDGPACIAPAA
jgi:hypothetical protein